MERVVELILDNLEIPQCITISQNIVTSMDKWCCPFWTFAHSVGKECALQKKAPVHRVARCRQMAYCVDHDAAPCTALKVQNCQLRQWIVVSSCSPTSYISIMKRKQPTRSCSFGNATKMDLWRSWVWKEGFPRRPAVCKKNKLHRMHVFF